MTEAVIAIDGVSYVGKSQIARALSRLTGFPYINTGHMYRALAKIAIEGQVSVNEDSLLDILKRTTIEFKPFPYQVFDEWLIWVNQEVWTDLLDRSDIVLLSSKIAQFPKIRNALTALQRGYAENQTIIMEGRDIGSVVFPNAKWKFYVTASVGVRASRMYKMLPDSEKRHIRNPESLIPKVIEIDEADKTRTIAPLIEAPDAFIYDNSESPSAEEDGLVLKYYIDHYDRPDCGRNQIKFTYQEVIAQNGKYIRA